VPEIGDVAVRELLISQYRLIYEVHPSAVYLLAFIHTSRDLAALWEREGRTTLDAEDR
jgi:hypothetical protein